jgi:hypothetical protein
MSLPHLKEAEEEEEELRTKKNFDNGNSQTHRLMATIFHETIYCE